MEKWFTLIEQFKENGYDPEDIQKIVLLHEMNKANEDMLNKMYEAEKDEYFIED